MTLLRRETAMGIVDKILDQTTPGLLKEMELTWRRNEALTSNISNAQTPQYRAVDLDFGAEVEKSFKMQTGDLAKTNSQHMDAGEPDKAHLIADYSGATRADGNNVDIDLQMGRLIYNQGKYNTAASILRKKLQMIRNAIREGGR